MHTDKKKKIVIIIAILLVVVLIVSLVMMLRELHDRERAKKEFITLAELVTYGDASGDGDTNVTDAHHVADGTNPENQDSGEGSEEDVGPKFERNLPLLLEENDDCVGWLCIEGTELNYPVMHTPEEPQKYLRKSFYGEYSMAGVPFLDERCSLDGEHLIFYGHNMKDGSMFGNLANYTSEYYYELHPTIEFETINGCREYTIFAVAVVKSTDEWYYYIKTDDEGEFNDSVNTIKSKALYDTGVTPVLGQQFITLSTCYTADEDGRLIVIAVG